MASVDDYLGLITPRHAGKAKFRASLAAIVGPLADAQAVTLGLPDKFDLDVAVGVQLDAVGVRVGVKRDIKTPIAGVYFSLGVDGVGFGQGYWRGKYDPLAGLTKLPDEFYRTYIRATVALNHWDSTLQAAVLAIRGLFPSNTIYVQDNQDMSMSLAIGGAVDTISAALLTGNYLALKPSSVRLKYYFPSLSPTPVFGLGADNAFIGGFGHGSWGVSAPVAPL